MEATNSEQGAAVRPIRIRKTLPRSSSRDFKRICTVVIATCATSLVRADIPADAASLKKLSVEELMNLEVTSVSKSEERFGGAAAAISVVTNESIRRSAAMSIPEALRGVAGIHVAAQNANQWAVSSRGFSSVNSEKLLVLSDTRSIYTPLYSGVFWDVQDYLMEDIDRIEVIKGPGAALWGSNAVNGVINITTKNAHDTHGLYAEAGAGTEEKVFGGIRFGNQSSGGTSYRVFAKYFDRDGSDAANAVTSDDTQLAHVGFRTDTDWSASDALTIQGDYYDGTIGRLAPSVTIIGRQGPQGDLEIDVSGGNLLGRWKRLLGTDSDFQLRAYYDHTRRDDPSFFDTLDTFDVDFQHRFPLATLRQQITWGLNYRSQSNRNIGKVIFALDPPSSTDNVASGFIQDQFTLSDTIKLTLGTKLENNDFSGFEIQPSVSAGWEISANQTLWAAISRAVRVPTRLERDIAVEVTPPGSNPSAFLLGNKNFDSEELIAYESGFRWQASDALYFGIAAYYNRYHGLSSLELGTPIVDAATGRVVFPVSNLNLAEGTATGVETQISYTPIKSLRIAFTHTYTNLDIDSAGQDVNRTEFQEGSTPRHQFGLRTFADLPHDFQFDAFVRRLSDVKKIPAIVNGQGLPGYTELDVRIAWVGLANIETSVVGKNLLHEEHLEFGDPATRGAVERAVYGMVTWRFP